MAGRFVIKLGRGCRSRATEARMRDRLAALEREFGPWESCDAALVSRHKRYLLGDIFDAELAITVSPTGRCIRGRCLYDDPEIAFNGALAEVHRSLSKAAAAERAPEKPIECSGHLVKLLPEQGLGVVTTDAGAQVSIRLQGEGESVSRALHVGDRVWLVADGGVGVRIVKVA